MPSRETFAYRRGAQMRAVRAVEDSASSTIETIYTKASDDFHTFCTLLDKPPAPHMLEWHDYLITGESNKYLLDIAGPNLDILSPRGSAKSTVLNMFTAWCIGRHTAAKRPLQIIYVSYNIATAIPKSRIIRQIVDSPEFRKIFPTCRLKPGMQSDIGWSIDFDYAGIPRVGDEEFTLRAAGLRGSITSKRAHLVLVDDPIKSSTDIRNPAIREEMMSNWSSVISPIIFEGGRAICLGTRFHPLDIHKTMFVPDKGWKQVTQEALTYDDKGQPKSYWQSQWSVEYLLQQKELDPVAFAFQYQQQPVMTSDLVVSPDLLVKGEVVTEFDSLAVGIDLSASKNETSDYTAFVLGGRLKDKYYIIDAHQCRSIGNLEKIDLLCDMLLEWGILTQHDGQFMPTYSTVTLVVESVAYQASLAADIKRVLINERDLGNLHIHEIKGFRGDKVARFRGTLGLLENKKVTFNKYRKFDALFDQLINVGATAHDDLLDAYVWLVTFLQRRGEFSIEY
jgi:phage terminase large subunit-like protein